MKKMKNNGGFTLVELIIAVAILAIVITPLISNFIQSSRLNLKGRKYLNEMNLAQDIMEGLSGYTADEINKCITEVKADTTGTKTLAGTIFPQGTDYGAITVTVGTDSVLTYEFEDVETVETNHNKYKVELVLDPTGTDQAEFNEKEMADIPEINQYYDAVFTLPDSDISSVITDMKGKSTKSPFVEDYEGNLVRTTTIKIENSGTEAAPNYKIGVHRNYKVASDALTTLGNDATDSVMRSTDNISRMDPDKFPRSVYIYFTGIKNASYNDTEKHENFVIENTTGNEITVYLIRTQATDIYGNISDDDRAYNSLFGCQVNIISKDMSGAETKDVHIVSNLRYDLNVSPKYNFRIDGEDGSDIEDLDKMLPTKDDGTKIPIADSTYKRQRAVYYYNGSLLTEDIYKTNFSAGYKRKEKNTLYKATINLYDPNTGDIVATFDGGVSN